MKSETSRTRLKFLEYKLLEKIQNGTKVDFKNNIVVKLSVDEKPIPSIMKLAQLLRDYELIDDFGNITYKGEKYLKTYPTPKVKHEPLKPMNDKDIKLLSELNDSKYEWTNSKYLIKKSVGLFKLVRYGYACGKKSDNDQKLHKDMIMPIPSLTIANTRSRYYFKITKKGKDFLNNNK